MTVFALTSTITANPTTPCSPLVRRSAPFSLTLLTHSSRSLFSPTFLTLPSQSPRSLSALSPPSLRPLSVHSPPTLRPLSAHSRLRPPPPRGTRPVRLLGRILHRHIPNHRQRRRHQAVHRGGVRELQDERQGHAAAPVKDAMGQLQEGLLPAQ